MKRDNQSNGLPSMAHFSIEMARGSSNLSNEVACSSGIINISDDDDDASDHLPIQNSIRLGATHLMEDVYAFPTRDSTSASGWATCPPDTSVNQIWNQSLLDRHQDFSNSHTNAAGFSGLPLHEESWSSLNNNQRLISGSWGLTSLPSQSLQSQQFGIQNFIPLQNNSMSSVPVSHHIPEESTDHAMENVPEFVGVTGYITSGSGRGDSPIDTSMAHIANRSFLHPCQDFSSFQRNAGWSSLKDNQRLMSGNDGLTSFPFQNLQTEQVGMQQFTPLQNNNGNSGCGWRGGSFSRPDQLGNHWQPQEMESLQQSIDFNMPYFSTGNLGIQQEREPFQHSIDLNGPAISTAWPYSAGLSNNFLTNDGTCLRRQTPLARTGQGTRAPNEYTQSVDFLTRQLQKTASNQSSAAIAANVRSSLPLSYHAPSPSDGQVTRAANELIRTQSFGISIGQVQKTSPNQTPPAITANDSSVVPSNFNRPYSSDGPHIPVANVEQASCAHAGSSVKRKATGLSLMNRPSVQRTKITPFPSTQPPVSFANQNGASTASAQPHVSLTNQNAVSVASTQLPVSFANQNPTGVASARPLIPFANQNAASIASGRPLVSFANQNAASISSARLSVSFANQNAASRASAQPPVSFANQIATGVASAQPHVSFANQNTARISSVQQAVSFANQNDTSVVSARPPVSFDENAARIVSAQTAVLFANHNATGVASARPPVSFANQNASRISSAQRTVPFANQNTARIASAQPAGSFANQNPATVASAQPPIPFANPDAAITRQRVRTRGPFTQQRVRTRGPSTGQRVRTRGPSTQQRVRTRGPSTQQRVRTRGPSQLQSSLIAASTLLLNRTPVSSFQQQSWAHPSSTQPQSRGHLFFTEPQSETPVPSTGLPEIAPIFYIERKVDPSCRPTRKVQVDCELCHKDLSEKPDGVASSEHASAPMSAVLPCGHVFHNHCLGIITPPDQSQIPPCIPCSLADHKS